MDVNGILEGMQRAMRRAGELMLRAHDVLAEAKTDRRNVVTEYDRAVQELLIRLLGETLPGARFFCEENDRQDDLGAEHLFIIDPIDGTMNFVHGFHHSCVSVAYSRLGRIEAGAVYNPYVNEMFTAIRGGGAFLNGRPIHVTDAPLSETVICFGSAPYNPELTGETFRLAQRAYETGLDVRREGSAALDLCSVAAGRAGVYFELRLSLWDYAAGSLIVEEAGGRCLGVDGSPLPFDAGRPSVLAGSKACVEAFLTLARQD